MFLQKKGKESKPITRPLLLLLIFDELMMTMSKIEKVWFDSKRIYLTTDNGDTLSRPLEAFPVLKDATESERLNFRIGRFGDDIRWEALDEDIHLSSFYESAEPNPDNEVARIFKQFPQLNVSETAKCIGISKCLLDKYIYGIKIPSEDRIRKIKQTLHAIGQELIAV